jgi:hypothetical protein
MGRIVRFEFFTSFYVYLPFTTAQLPCPLVMANVESWIEEGHKCRVRDSQDFLKNSPWQIDYLPFCAFPRILTVVLNVDTLTKQAYTTNH